MSLPLTSVGTITHGPPVPPPPAPTLDHSVITNSQYIPILGL